MFYRLAGNDIKIIIDSYGTDTSKIKPFELAFRLRRTTAMFRHLYIDLISEIINPFDKQVATLIAEKDNRKIYRGKVIHNNGIYNRRRQGALEHAIKGLEAFYSYNWKQAGNNFCNSVTMLETEEIPGFWAGVGLSLWVLNCEEEAKSVFLRVNKLIANQIYPSPNELPGKKDLLSKVQAVLDGGDK